jgi:hypothetical protein
MVVEDQSRPPLDHNAISSPSYFGWSSLEDDSESNFKDNEDAANPTSEDYSPRLEW